MKLIRLTAALALLLCAATLVFIGCKSERTSANLNQPATAATAAPKPYPLDKCVVSGEAFEHGKPYTFVYNGQEIKLCCKDCLADFNKDPQKYLAKINRPK